MYCTALENTFVSSRMPITKRNGVIVNNVKSMLKSRGYAVIVDKVDDYPHKYISHYMLCADLSVYFIEDVKVNIDIIKSIIASVIESESPIKKFIIVYEKSLTPDAKNATIINNVFEFELFNYDEMAFDIKEIIDAHEHYDKPFKERNKLPVILSTDRVARYYAFKKGDLILIRHSDDDVELRRCV